MAVGEFHHCIQVKIDESLETFSAEQRFHGEGLDTIESLGRGRCGLVFFLGQLQLHWAIVHPTSASAVVSDVHTRICAPDSLAHDCLYYIRTLSVSVLHTEPDKKEKTQPNLGQGA